MSTVNTVATEAAATSPAAKTGRWRITTLAFADGLQETSIEVNSREEVSAEMLAMAIRHNHLHFVPRPRKSDGSQTWSALDETGHLSATVYVLPLG